MGHIDFTTPGNISYDMILYLKIVINDFPEKITGVASTPVADHLFKICNLTEICPLPKSQVIAYHHTTAQLIFLTRVCCNIQTKVAFLTTRVKAPDEDDWGKVQHVLIFLNGTRYPKLTFWLNLSLFFTGMLMLHVKLMKIVPATLAQSLPSAQELCVMA